MKRKIKRRYRRVKGNSGVKFLGFIGIIVGAVVCGYLTARFVVAPLLGYETEVLKLDFPSKLTALTDEPMKKAADVDEVEEESKAEKTEKTEASELTAKPSDNGKYVLQFGVFSSESGAKELVESLKRKSIHAEIKKIDGNYKVLSNTFDTKDAALNELETLKEKQNIDVFITVIQ